MSSTALELLSFTARRLIQFETRFYHEKMERRRAIAEYFAGLSSAIQSVASDLERQRVPHESTRELAKLTSQLESHIAEILGEQETERLRQFMEQACDTERIYREFNQTLPNHYLVDEMNKATILLKALSQGLFIPSQESGHSLSSGFTDPVL